MITNAINTYLPIEEARPVGSEPTSWVFSFVIRKRLIQRTIQILLFNLWQLFELRRFGCMDQYHTTAQSLTLWCIQQHLFIELRNLIVRIHSHFEVTTVTPFFGPGVSTVPIWYILFCTIVINDHSFLYTPTDNSDSMRTYIVSYLG